MFENPHPQLKNRVWKFVAGLDPKYVLVVFLLLAGVSIFFTAKLKFSYDYEDFFPKGDPDLDFYYLFREKFEHDDNFLLVGFKPENGIFEKQFLTKLDSATSLIGKINNVGRVYSITNFNYFVKSPFGFIDYPALHIDEEERYAFDSTRIQLDERIKGKLISEDFSTAVIFIKTNDTLVQEESKGLIDDVTSSVQKAGLQDYHLLGKSNFQIEIVKIQHREFIVFSLLSVLLVSIVTYLMFRNFWCVFISMLTVGVSLMLFTGILGAAGIEQNVMSTLFPIVIIIIGISDAVHFIGKYIIELRKNPNKNIALFKTLADIGFATFLTAVTSAIGFMTMLTSNVPPIKFFGVLSGLGVLLVYFVVLFFISPLLKLFSLKQLDSLTKKDENNWGRFINSIYFSGKDHPSRILLTGGLILFVFIFGMTRISTDIHLEAGMPKNAQVTKDFHFFEENFNGFRPLEIAAEAKNGFTIDSPEILKEIDKVETYVKSFDIINGVQSITMVYKSLNRAYEGDDPAAYKLPDEEIKYKMFANDLKKTKLSEINVLISEDKKYGRISGFVSDTGTDSIRSVQNSIKDFIAKNTNPEQVAFTVTGTGIIFDKNTEYLRNNIISGVLLAFLCIGIVMAFMFRNWKMVIISIIPNIIPLVVCAGIMGLLKIELDAPTSIIFGISYGIAVDDTIHFLSKFRIERMKGADMELAIRNTFHETGKAVFIMSVILLFGFLILLFSPTAAIFNIGLLTGITLFSAIWPDVFLIPIMLRKWMK
ncbi:MAG: RND family transporter [Chitinophagales bacterium]